ncbi:MAG: aryl-sulfate sulfotransferase, partial [Deltaproteobacteria bacterium]|nr:aryl-sulfate sulfotransferase [Deltaproteobacteria bacterium]
MRAPSLLLSVLCLVAACAPSGGAGDGEVAADAPSDVAADASPVPVEITDFVITAHPGNPLAAYVEWQTAAAASTAVEVDCGPEHQALIDGPGLRTEHRVFVMGLLPGVSCLLRGRSEGPDGSSDDAEGSFTAGTVPDDLPAPELAFAALDRVQPGWTLVNLTNTFDNVPLHVALLDGKGRYRWILRRSGPHTGLDTDVRLTPLGISIGGVTHQDTPSIVDWEGRVVWEGDFFNHHEFRPVPGDADRFFAFTGEKDACGWGFNSQVVVIHDLWRHEHVWEWRLCENWTPPAIVEDWSHLNTIEPFPGEGAILLSSREQNTLFKVSWPAGELLWGLGEQGDFTFTDGTAFYHQHAPELTPEGTILLFDNGLHDQREWSRALEIGFDEESRTAHTVWEFRPDPDIYAPVWGDADRLPNGNTLVVFGLWDPTRPTHLIEVGPDAEEVWHLVLPPRWGVYRGERIPDPPAG